ncbi:hypothetical protein Q4560_04845 [Celeribacter halophilus]|jgi:hypothetical protein|uniref:Uncharacterized protein n=2 Tax=Celeribacter halophilus TaxID=576117 RepID=A0AAW7XU27_9RHOB|nr:hypothetical protein [Celeribacter halophilus]MDO6457903.1 hypothetical protein [Celeribacter halophilus]MDO6722584.1 hypothetical protein [Celeribacter halophilus]
MPKSLSKILNKLKSCLIGVVIFLVVMPVVSILFSAMSYLSYGVFKLLHPNTETSYTTPGYFFALSWILTLMAAMFVIWFIILLRALRPLLKKKRTKYVETKISEVRRGLITSASCGAFLLLLSLWCLIPATRISVKSLTQVGAFGQRSVYQMSDITEVALEYSRGTRSSSQSARIHFKNGDDIKPQLSTRALALIIFLAPNNITCTANSGFLYSGILSDTPRKKLAALLTPNAAHIPSGCRWIVDSALDIPRHDRGS